MGCEREVLVVRRVATVVVLAGVFVWLDHHCAVLTSYGRRLRYLERHVERLERDQIERERRERRTVLAS
jgi:hypothetical protein